jgi:hypothetical protein
VAAAAVFADGAPLVGAERLAPVVAAYLVTAAIVGFIFGIIRPSGPRWWVLGIYLSLPALAAIGLLGRDIGLHLQILYYLVALASSCCGAMFGMTPVRLFRRRG